MSKVLILEDDADLRAELHEALEDEAFEVRTAGTIAEFWQTFQVMLPAVAILDMNLPDGRGRDVVRQLRSQSQVGILVLSGQRDEADRVIALELGADDFVTKPCGPRELAARLNAILRRTEQAAPSPSKRRCASFAGHRLDLMSMELRAPGGEVLPLTTAEFQLLQVFVERPQRVLSRDQLLDLMRGQDWAGYDRTVDGLVSRLRKKIRQEASSAPVLKTVHGSGYMFTPSVT
ncbi:MAG: response regulator transcription factor [Pseudomonadota bacterium]